MAASHGLRAAPVGPPRSLDLRTITGYIGTNKCTKFVFPAGNHYDSPIVFWSDSEMTLAIRL